MTQNNALWQLVIIILLVIVAIFLVLNIEHPEFVENLFIWRAEGERSITTQMGLDLGGGRQITLAPRLDEGESIDPELLEETRQIIESRAQALSPTTPEVTVQDETIVIQLPAIEGNLLLTDTLSMTGQWEFVSMGASMDCYSLYSQGALIETSLGAPDIDLSALMQPIPTETITTTTIPTTTPGVMTNTQVATTTDDLITTPVTPTSVITPTLPQTYTFPYGQTIWTGTDIEMAAFYPSPESPNLTMLNFLLQEGTANVLATYAALIPAGTNDNVCVALDKAIIGGAILNNEFTPWNTQGNVTPLSVPVFIPPIYADTFSLLLNSSPLPYTMDIIDSGPAEPLIGTVAVQNTLRATLIGLGLLLIALIVYYRLPGLLAGLAMALFGLFMLALARIAPIPVTLPTLTAFIATATLCLAEITLLIERFRAEARKGTSIYKALTSSLSRDRSSPWNLHIASALIGVIVWYTGIAMEIPSLSRPGGVLILGTLISLLVSRVVAQTLIYLVISETDTQLNKHKWLLGI